MDDLQEAYKRRNGGWQLSKKEMFMFRTFIFLENQKEKYNQPGNK